MIVNLNDIDFSFAMTDSRETAKKANRANRNLWMENSLNHMNKGIQDAASNGARGCWFDLNELFRGAENLNEVAEMATLIQNTLTSKGYEVIVDLPEPKVIVTW